MKFPNLAWALRYHRLQPSRFAVMVGLDGPRFNRGLSGDLDFTPAEREGIARALAFREAWLFAEPTAQRTVGEFSGGLPRGCRR